MQGFFIVTALAGATFGQSTFDLMASFKRPPSAAPLPRRLIGLSIEADRWNDWTGNLTHPNDFTYTLLDNLKQKTGEAPSIRVGGATQDHLIWAPGVDGAEVTFPAVPAEITSTKQLFPECSSGKIGGDWYLLSGNLPSGTSFIWGANFGADSSSEVITQVKAIEEAFSDPRLRSVTLQSIELGNEPDYWAGSYRPNNWTVASYVDQYNQFVEDIDYALGSNSLRFQLGAFAGSWTGIEVADTDIFQNGLLKSLHSFSEHHYSNTADFTTRPPSEWPAIRSQLITKSNIRGNLTRYGTSAKFFHNHGLEFYLGETNTMYGHGMPGVSNSAAAALWVIDYALQAARLGIDTLHFHSGVGYNYSAFQPIDHLGSNITDYNPHAKRHIAPLYTGLIAVADVIGKSDDTWIDEIDIDDDHLAIYSIWEGSKLARIMVINSVPWEIEMQRPRQTIDVTLPDIDVSRAKFKRLSIPSLGALDGVTWGGQSWETYSGHVKGEEMLETPSRLGVIRLEASSAVLIYL